MGLSASNFNKSPNECDIDHAGCRRFCSGLFLFPPQSATTFNHGGQAVPSKTVIFHRIQQLTPPPEIRFGTRCSTLKPIGTPLDSIRDAGDLLWIVEVRGLVSHRIDYIRRQLPRGSLQVFDSEVTVGGTMSRPPWSCIRCSGVQNDP